MRKAASELTRQLAKAKAKKTKTGKGCFSCSVITSDCEESFILNLYYKGKGEALDRGNHRGLKLTDRVTKLLEWVLDFYIHEMVNI